MINYLVGGFEHGFYDFPFIGNTMECHHPNWLIFFRGVGQPPTRWFLYIYQFLVHVLSFLHILFKKIVTILTILPFFPSHQIVSFFWGSPTKWTPRSNDVIFLQKIVNQWNQCRSHTMWCPLSIASSCLKKVAELTMVYSRYNYS